jgi:hypothetical protein
MRESSPDGFYGDAPSRVPTTCAVLCMRFRYRDSLSSQCAEARQRYQPWPVPSTSPRSTPATRTPGRSKTRLSKVVARVGGSRIGDCRSLRTYGPPMRPTHPAPPPEPPHTTSPLTHSYVRRAIIWIPSHNGRSIDDTRNRKTPNGQTRNKACHGGVSGHRVIGRKYSRVPRGLERSRQHSGRPSGDCALAARCPLRSQSAYVDRLGLSSSKLSPLDR